MVQVGILSQTLKRLSRSGSPLRSLVVGKSKNLMRKSEPNQPPTAARPKCCFAAKSKSINRKAERKPSPSAIRPKCCLPAIPTPTVRDWAYYYGWVGNWAEVLMSARLLVMWSYGNRQTTHRWRLSPY